ncbi:MAG TPA: hypothetical protein DEP45_04710 [Armatimonadetes bacterium]|nr:hypothetical protein [Armatimonadota bacterium]
MRRAALILISLISAAACFAEQLEIIDLLHLNAPEFAASLAGRSAGADVLESETTAFAADVLRDVSQQTRGRSSVAGSLTYSRAQSIPGAGADLSGLLPDGLSSPPVATPNRNALIVRGTPEAIDKLREVIAMLDVPTPMVNIDLLMDQITREFAREIYPRLRSWGWAGELSAGADRPPVLGFAAGGFSLSGGYDAGSSSRRTRTGANITGMSGMPLVISAGEVRPRISSCVWYDNWGQRHVDYATEAAFAGITLWVLPTVHADNTITMVLRPMLSEFAGFVDRAGAGEIVRRTLVETTVRVPDGQSLVIGGLDRRLDEISRSFPGGGGSLSADDSSVITVTPTIIRMQG